MHQLHLLRHAKSSWDDDADDHQRPLNRRGREAARLIGETLPKAIGELDLVLCSTALRAREPAILYENGLYLATAEALLHRLQQLDEADGAVMVVGHNPGLHELAAALADPGSSGFSTLANGKFPTGVRVRFTVATSWAELDTSRHRLVDYVTVKSLGGED
jgi:phosphohistidine phosphatase